MALVHEASRDWSQESSINIALGLSSTIVRLTEEERITSLTPYSSWELPSPIWNPSYKRMMLETIIIPRVVACTGGDLSPKSQDN
jgi:hypothetical protein